MSRHDEWPRAGSSVDDAHFFFSFASDPDHVVAKCSVMNLSSSSANLSWVLQGAH
ncbi:hypothetical protein M758_11G041800 [Ceratodon purpureus]|uniref:Uncharacterized protein n=1 Tax=Ceratodon purpureus TaxID=3225 RepID=A0A8T0GD85_CERPU|nr:hypothetical protein KC19_11G043300 [Ceratodon purpureus]KAG0600533.1 hypothetical protein M758_11G041800 [Ceratodon purpureus]